eukprot:scaffold15.g4260.t1
MAAQATFQASQRAVRQGSQAFRPCGAPVKPMRRAHARQISCQAQGGETSRRQTLQLAGLAAAAPLLAALPAAAAKTLKGFNTLSDAQDGYSFLYPFGWQEVSVDGLDVVFKDVIEPLESVSVSFVPTEKKDVAEFGDAKEVAYTLADHVLTSPTQQVKLVDVVERLGEDGRRYYDFEFKADSRTYTRHALASVTVGNGKFYTLETGANERRWGKMKDKVKATQQSFTVIDRY